MRVFHFIHGYARLLKKPPSKLWVKRVTLLLLYTEAAIPCRADDEPRHTVPLLAMLLGGNLHRVTQHPHSRIMAIHRWRFCQRRVQGHKFKCCSIPGGCHEARKVFKKSKPSLSLAQYSHCFWVRCFQPWIVGNTRISGNKLVLMPSILVPSMPFALNPISNPCSGSSFACLFSIFAVLKWLLHCSCDWMRYSEEILMLYVKVYILFSAVPLLIFPLRMTFTP